MALIAMSRARAHYAISKHHFIMSHHRTGAGVEVIIIIVRRCAAIGLFLEIDKI